MKKLFLFLVVFSIHLIKSTALATELISWIPYIIDEKAISHGTPKSPVHVPVVTIEDHTLAFICGHPEYILTIKDEEGDVVYATVVSTSVTQVALPSMLNGVYQIELTQGNWVFVGEITV